MEVTWIELKRVATQKGLALQYAELESNYYIKLVDGVFSLETLITKDPINSDTADFLVNYLPAANRAIVNKQAALSNPEDYRFRGDGTPWTAIPANTTASSSLVLSSTDVKYLDGGVVVTSNANPGDYCVFNIVHPQAGVVETFVKKWYVQPGSAYQEIKVYPAAVPPGITVRIDYVNIGPNDASFGVNLRIHRKGNGT
jgi:hypothetical protein